MSKSIAVVGTRGLVHGPAFLETNTLMSSVGNNSGNLVFQYGVANLLAEPYKVLGQEISWDPADLKDNARVIVVPTANIVRPNFNVSQFFSVLEKAELPLLFVGLGAEGDLLHGHNAFHPSVFRLIDLIKERSPAVGVRGDITANLLSDFGVDNMQVIGCPSNFINPTSRFPFDVEELLRSQSVGSFIVHGNEPWPHDDVKSRVERRLAEWSYLGSSVYVQQAVPALQNFIRDKASYTSGAGQRRFEVALRESLLPGLSPEQMEKFIATRWRTYYSVDQWLEDSARFDFSLGYRLHGNMVAFQAGVPALFLVNDTRTKELADAMLVPKMTIEEFDTRCGSVEDAWESTYFDARAYTQRRKLLWSRIEEVFSAAAVRISHPALSHSI